MSNKVKHYSPNVAYELLIDGQYKYYGSHCSKEDYLRPLQIMYGSGNRLKTKYYRHEISADEYKERVKLVNVWEFDTPEEALTKEKKLIESCYENDREHCYNLLLGNNHDIKLSESRRTALIKHNIAKMNTAARKKIRQLDKNGDELAVYFSVREAAKQLNLWESNISRALTTKNHTAGGYRWEYV